MLQLTEHIRDWHAPDLLVDHAHRLIKNVALTGAKSKNGYRYAEHALREAVPLYDNKPVFLDHAPNAARPCERSARDLVGSIANPRFANGRIRGDIRLLDTESGRTFMALAQSNAPAVGMSHVVVAQRSSDKTTVERIHDVVSVDAVVFPATTSTLNEQQSNPSTPTDDAPVLPTQADDVTSNEPPPPTLEHLHSTIATLTAERDHLRARLDEIQRQRRQQQLHAEIEQLLEHSRLPGFCITETFRNQLAAAPDPPARQALIAERLELLSRCSRAAPTSRERLDPTSPSPHSDAAIIATLKRHHP